MNPMDEFEALLEATGAARSEPLATLAARLSQTTWLPTLLEVAALRWSWWHAGNGDLLELLRPASTSKLEVLLRAAADLPLVALERATSGAAVNLHLLGGEIMQVPAAGEEWAPGRPLALFEERFRNALRQGGYPSRGADLLMAALREMESNAIEHAQAPIPPLACYQIHPKGWLFCVTDVGCGVLESLRRNPAYGAVTHALDALDLALRPGVSCTGEPGRGQGFAALFKALADRDCRLRVRTGGVGGRWSGTSPTAQTLDLMVLPERVGLHVVVGASWPP